MNQVKNEPNTIVFDKNEWQIVLSDKSNKTHHCICGHHVKRITYIYNKNTKELLCIGTTCVKKYGIHEHMKNGILLLFIKNMIHTGELYDDSVLKIYIQDKYLSFREKIMEYSSSDEIDYYDIVAPFRRLLNDVCDLVTEYKYDLTILLKEIEKDVDSMNSHTKHIMIDETVVSSANSEEVPAEEIPESSYISEVWLDTADDILTVDTPNVTDNAEIIIQNEYSHDIADVSHKMLPQLDGSNEVLCKRLLYDVNSSFIDPPEPYYVMNFLNYENTCQNESFELIEELDHSLVYSDFENIDIYDLLIENSIGECEKVKDQNELTGNEEAKEIDANILWDKPVNTDFCENIQIEPMIIGNKTYKISICCNQPYCYCDLKYRFYALHLEIAQLKKDMTEFNMKTAKLLKQAREFHKAISE